MDPDRFGGAPGEDQGSGPPPEPTPPSEEKAATSSWDRCLDRFREHLLVDGGLSENTITAYSEDAASLRDFCLQRGVDTPSETDWRLVADHLEEAREARLAPRTLSRRLASLNRFCQFLRQSGAIDRNPISFLDRPRGRRTLINYCSRQEIAELVDAAPGETPLETRNRALLEVLYGCGLRASELVALRGRDVNWEQRELRVVGKGRKTRFVPVGRPALEWMQRYVDEFRAERDSRGRSEAFFLTIHGNALSRQRVWQLVKHYAREAGIPDVTPHTLRHSFATHMLAGGADLRSLQKLLGHADVGTTSDLYVHLRDEVRETHHRFHPRG